MAHAARAHVVSSVAELWGGIGLLTRSGGGMYVLAAGLLIHGGIALTVVWFIFVSISEEEAAEIPQEDAQRRGPSLTTPNPANAHSEARSATAAEYRL